MAWSVDQASLGPRAIEAGFGDTAMQFTSNVAVAANAWAFILVAWFFSDPLTSCVDNGPGLTWTRHQVRPDPAGDLRLAICRAFAPAGIASGTVWDLGWTGGDVGNKVAGGVSFLGGDSSSFDAALAAAFSTGAAAWSIPATTDDAGELIVVSAFAGNGPGNTITSPSVEDWEQAASGSTIVAAHRIAGAAGATSVAGTWAFSDAWGAYGLRLNEAAAGGPPPDSSGPIGNRVGAFDPELLAGAWF